jgi:hypothetical protein
MDGVIISPLVQAMIGDDVNEIHMDENVIKIRRPELVDDVDVSNRNVLIRLVNRLLLELEGGDAEDEDPLYNNIVTNVYACKMFSSRRIGVCYVTNKSYGEDCDDMVGHVFDGAQTALGARWFYSAFPYHKSSDELIPFVDARFNFSEFMVPIVDFPNILQLADGKQYIHVNVKRTSGIVQRGIVKINPKTMVTYRVIDGTSFVHPAYADAGAKLTPIVTVYFNHDGTDPVFDDMGHVYPVTDCSKDVSLDVLIENNSLYLYDAFKIGDHNIPEFRDAFRHSIRHRFLSVHDYVV